MRATITVTPEAQALVQKAMRERGVTFNKAVNDAIVTALTAGRPRESLSIPTVDMGRATVTVERALQLAGNLEDEEWLRKTSVGT